MEDVIETGPGTGTGTSLLAESISSNDSIRSIEEGGGVKMRPKIPFSKRVNPFLDSKDQEFLDMEAYFFSLLRSSESSVREILEAHFDDHEIDIITPGPPWTAKWQFDNASRYYKNLEEGRFKGHTASLPFKMACLYFGFPVEPIRSEALSAPFPTDLGLFEREEISPVGNPLSFLENPKEVVLGGDILGLRGGGGGGDDDDDAVEDIPAEGYGMDVDWDDLSQYPDAGNTIRIFSWQGAMNASLHHVDFVSQVDRLTSNWEHKDGDICLEIWQRAPRKLVDRVTGRLRHSRSTGAGDRVWELVEQTFSDSGSRKEYVCFVHFADEPHPRSYEPSVQQDRHIVRIEDEESQEVAYMRVPAELTLHHKPHQFSMEYTQAMRLLGTAETSHAWVLYQDEGEPAGISYTHLDPPGEVFDQISAAQTSTDSPLTIKFTRMPVDSSRVPVIVPGHLQPSEAIELERSDFTRTTDGDGNMTGLMKLFDAIRSVKGENVMGYECNGLQIWLPGEGFKSDSTSPFTIVVSTDGTNDAQSLKDWKIILDTVERRYRKEAFGIVARPVFRSYRLHSTGRHGEMEVQINQCDLVRFKSSVRERLYANYNPRDPSHVIVLGPSTEGRRQAEFVIRQETTEEEWRWICRNVTEPDLTVAFRVMDNNKWSIPHNSSWGPREVARPTKRLHQAPTGMLATGLSRLTGETTKAKGTAGGSGYQALDHVFKDSGNTMNEATRARILRDRSFHTPASIFTNPLKPVMPLYGPPLEPIIKTGPGVPGVSIAMVTPTEMLKLQHEVHSLRLQLLDRTRVCPYADCDRYFTYADGDGLDRHVREDHTILRCFLCRKDENLLPYYNAAKIQEHFVHEHVNDILEAYGGAAPPMSREGAQPEKRHTDEQRPLAKDRQTPAGGQTGLKSTVSEVDDAASMTSSDFSGQDSTKPARNDAHSSRTSNKRKRKRLGELDTRFTKAGAPDEDEAYEYSERSAVSDPLENIEPVGAPAPKKKRSITPSKDTNTVDEPSLFTPPGASVASANDVDRPAAKPAAPSADLKPANKSKVKAIRTREATPSDSVDAVAASTTVTRTGRRIRPTRAAREAVR
ncbi:hypothetical protein GGS20DRAFT_565876 [Poronia punctata]|nr:hypothetical protein GGS20DRAFT_565876 [Poronia punctata]